MSCTYILCNITGLAVYSLEREKRKRDRVRGTRKRDKLREKRERQRHIGRLRQRQGETQRQIFRVNERNEERLAEGDPNIESEREGWEG